MAQNINRRELAQKAHAVAVEKGFWQERHLPEHYLMLVITELSEAVEAHRKGRHANRKVYDECKKELKEFSARVFEMYIKDSIADELADAYIRLMDLSVPFEYEVGGVETKAQEEIESLKEEPFTCSVYAIISLLEDETKYGYISETLSYIEDLATAHGIDLAWHIEEKMGYNALRPALHGKAY